MIEKNDFYKKLITKIVSNIRKSYSDKKTTFFSPANTCLLANAYTLIYKRKNINNEKIDYSLNVKPIGAIDNEDVNVMEFLQDDIGKLPIEIFPKAKTFIYLFIYLFIYWEQNKYKNNRVNISNPYLPIMKIFERGGYIYRDNTIKVNERSVPRSFLLGKLSLELPIFNDDFLDFIDEKFQQDYLPNQEEIDRIFKIWEQGRKVKTESSYKISFQESINQFIKDNNLRGWQQFYENFVSNSFIMNNDDYLAYLQDIRCPFGFIGTASKIMERYSIIEKLVPKKADKELIQTLAIICSGNFLEQRNISCEEWLNSKKWIDFKNNEEFSIIDILELYGNAYIKIKVMSMPIFKIF